MVSIHLGFLNYSAVCVFSCSLVSRTLSCFEVLRKKGKTPATRNLFPLNTVASLLFSHAAFSFQISFSLLSSERRLLAPGNKVGAVGRHERTSRQWRRRRRRTFLHNSRTQRTAVNFKFKFSCDLCIVWMIE